MKKTVYIGLFIFSGWFGNQLAAQQLPQYTQFMFNDFVLNPAVAGTADYYQIRSNSRFQWVGILDAPQTISLSIYGPHKEKPMGFGGYLYSDVTGPTSRTGLYGTYAYNIEAWPDIRLSMGLSLGLLQNKVDGTEIQLIEENDPVFQGGVYSAWVPDASLGFYLYHDNWFAGFSAFQLFSNNIKVYDMKNGLNRLKHHYYLMGGYATDIHPDFRLEVSAMLKGTTPVPLQLEFNARTTYRETFWMGLSYRTKDAASILLGYIHENRFMFGYSYDISTSTIRSFNSGTHEIMIGVRLNPIR
ncbi:MAG TPA: type IX secretion system membrane protein PorP/SprF [Bacteroidetes bacterium]|nr:type IX secretion system membrane protein PorP/SprF [Bacteroidota bacterium]